MNRIKVLFFATIRDHMGTKQLELQLREGADVQELKKQLAAQVPGAANAIDTALASINREYALPNEVIPEGAEVALFPHVSGG